MAKQFNTAGICIPERNYMVEVKCKMDVIVKDYIDAGKYFTISRARQYGKTTMLYLLEQVLKTRYLVLRLSFEAADEMFVSLYSFATGFVRRISRILKTQDVAQDLLDDWHQPVSEQFPFDELSERITSLCCHSDKPVILMIDEVDKSSDNQVFLSFLGLLRNKYLEQMQKNDNTFQSVVLAGVYDIKNLKSKFRPVGEQKYNSPWNIAAKFKIDMSFSTDQITSMLAEYEADYHTGMDIHKMAEEIYQYTSGYPVLVSSICKYIDEDLTEEHGFENLGKAWTTEGITRAVKAILADKIPLFESMIRHLDEYPAMKKMFQAILFEGNEFAYNPYTKEMNLAYMFGYAVDRDGKVQIVNRIFEMCLYNYFLSEEELSSAIGNKAKRDKRCFIHDGMLDMDEVMKKFVEHFHEIYGNENMNFIEKFGRKIFLLYLRPIINGTGNYYIEAQTRDERRTDIIVDYLGEQFIIELKIWHGNEYNERGERQLAEYLDYYHKDKGYLLSFNFNKKKEIGVKEVPYRDKKLIEAVV